ncbi:helix-turn-helix transcriptional regulator [Mesorhizobium sp. M0026]|uniref:helix-turn-helix transcriptional regulator n=1 Tax=Mesorhizobium sp. M0026 TaxID=2956847 RepID=UPI00333DC21C
MGLWLGRTGWCKHPVRPRTLSQRKAFDNLTNKLRNVNPRDKHLTYGKISAAQCRGARAMLGMSQGELANAARVSRPTVVDFERGARVPHANNVAAIRHALEAAGIEFIPDNGGGAGVRLAVRSDGN